ncbi:MAG: hypothetical protein GY953_17330, partial [bacterium]|nr:hypothetical protein [bacterium]
VTGSDIPEITLRLRPPLRLSGRVETPGESRVDFSRLRILLRPLEAVSFHPQGGARFDEEGRFEITDLETARYRLRLAGLPPGSYVKSARLADRDVLENGLELSDGSDGEELQLVISDQAAKIEVLVRDLSAGPAAGALVALIPEGRTDRTDLYRMGGRRRDGRYVLYSVTPGRYTLIAASGAPPGAWLDPDFVKRYEDRGVSIRLSEGDRKTVEVDLAEIE